MSDAPTPSPVPDQAVPDQALPASAGVLACPACGEPSPEGARFCEACGTPLAPLPPAGDATDGAAVDPVAARLTPADGPAAPTDGSHPDPVSGGTAPGDGATDPGTRPCVRCGGRVAEDGYCTECGEPAASERDHWAERPATWVAGVCDRGVRHSRNEDAMALAASPSAAADRAFAALVVCDGVSSAPDSDVASLAAARAARDLLAAGAPEGTSPVVGEPTARVAAWSALVANASRAAQDAILTTVGAMADRENPPSCTFVAAVVDGPLVVTGWVGDSRAYWIPDTGEAHQLSVDDSWAQEMMAQGIPRAQAESSPQAHAITRWLGPDAPDPVARTAATFPDRDGWVLVCSDGLWNYCSPAGELAALLHSTQERVGHDPQTVAGALVDWANAQGGRDNITATLARFDRSSAPASPELDPDLETTIPTT
ncbi:serine/threonine protein phosphatase PrpC/RNA polymerase subunit RPABC4/transcription elongation factor Spt4 [Cellulosimicrobium cellulans]|uniref:PP2C family serine/threonine-protein phosphatase n=1 Tax=Cellulosimicrobium cellulans TaxID=1710 RepID=UPI0019572545|nr:PP2C family serine/threonine-protein phosphatase [Cellulosimicrobium cellulans]MBM7819400.1 serine/threonine protein phosphatase PrpC/RNA polymerase subunit RPABC4/transcription elongation factor Spt4 [Cellulosimicrobium cellulans]